MTSTSRRNACPTIARPMETGDGLLVRLPPTGSVSPDAIRAICDAARDFGNGIVEITARGSIQVRGITDATTSPFVAALAAAGIRDASLAILKPPLAGLDPTEIVDVRLLVRMLRDAVEAESLGARLAPKTSVVIDGGGSLHLDATDADLRLVATDDMRFALAVGGTAAMAKAVGAFSSKDVVAAALTLLRMIADAGPMARGRDLDRAAVAAVLGAGPVNPMPRRPPAEPIGVHALRNGAVAAGVGLRFGQTDAATLAALVDAAADCGATAFAPTEGRTLIAIGIAHDGVAGFRDRAAALGFIVRPDDPRRAVIACAGAPACAGGLMPARAVAADVAEAATPMLDGSVTLHISGCAKGCAHPRAATLTFAGGEHGAGLVVSGRASDAAVGSLEHGNLPAAIARLAAEVRTGRRDGETSAGAMARLGASRLAAVFAREPADA